MFVSPSEKPPRRYQFLKTTTTRRLTWLAVLLTACIVYGRICLVPETGKRVDGPNVLLIVVDTLRADRLSQYGYHLRTSPSLDGFVRQSTLFKNAYAPTSWTIPSTATIHTGLHPGRHQTLRHGDVIRPSIDTLAERLRRRGYRTAGFSHNVNVSAKARFDQGFELFKDHKGDAARIYPDVSRMIGDTRRWLSRYARNAHPRPFFLYLQPMNVHGPYKVPRAHQKDLLSRRPAKGFRFLGRLMNDIMTRGKTSRRKDVTPKYLNSLNEKYDTAVRYTTDQLKIVFDALKARGLWDDTLVIFTSDHGEELFDHGGLGHAYTLFEEVVHVPLIIKRPHQSKRVRSEALVALADIYPTVLEIAGGGRQPRTDGRSLEPLLYRADTPQKARRIKALKKRKLMLHFDWPSRGKSMALHGQHYKYIHVISDYERSVQKRLLFNLVNDQNEQSSLTRKMPKLARKMHRIMSEQWRKYTQGAQQAPKMAVDKANLEALRALGYIQ